MDSFIGEIRVFGFSFPPEGWASCDGTIMSVGQSQALYAVIGNFFGGTPMQNFALPDLRGRAPMAAGAGPGLTSYVVGKASGAESVMLGTGQNALHDHTLNAQVAGGAAGIAAMSNVPTATSWLSRLSHKDSTTKVTLIQDESKPPVVPSTTLADSAIGVSGGGLPHENRQPSLAMNFCIALTGDFPMRPD